MDSENNQMEQQTVQCRNGCGFYGNAGTEGYCSVCYKEAIKKKQQPPTGMPASLAPTPNSMATLSLQGESSTAAAAAGASAAEGGNNETSSNNNLNTGSPTVLTVPSQIIAKSAQQSDSEMADATPTASTASNTSVDVQMSSPSTSSSVEAVASTSAVAAAAAVTAGAEDSNEGGAGGKKKKNRCGVCKKKVGLTGFSCRCEGLFCPVHRYSDKHDCKFDYKELGAEEIKKSNPVVVASKIQKI